MLHKYKFDIWDIIIWISLLILIIYIIAKLTGLINTPEWVDILPIITLVFFAGAFYQKVLGFMERIFVRTDYLKKSIDEIRDKITEHNKRISLLEKKR